MITWMLYSALVALIVAVAGRAAEWLGRLAGYRVRWIWLGALALTAYLSASAPMRRTGVPIPTGASSAIELGEAAQINAHASWRVRIDDVRHSLGAPLRDALATV